MRTKKIYLTTIITFAVVIFSLLGKNFIYESYIKLFRVSTIIEHRNKEGKLDGAYIAYVDGKVFGRSYFKNGLRDGWCIWYNDRNGKKKRELFYRHGQPDGVENVYYDNGSLNYTTIWKNDKYDQSQYHYLEDGRLNTYNAFDKSMGRNNGYCLVSYDKSEKFHQILGHVFSDYIYSVCKDSIVLLVNNNRYKCIADLYMSVATPPHMVSSVSVTINNRNFNKVSVKNNAAVVAGVFNKAGIYQIRITGILKNVNGHTVKTDSLNTRIIKE